jgi:hypothetical protein
LGVVLPYQIVQIGDDWGIGKNILGINFEFLQKETLRDIARNWPTAYWQMPQRGWFEDPNEVCPWTIWFLPQNEQSGNFRNCGFIVEYTDANDDGVVQDIINDPVSTLAFLRNVPNNAGDPINVSVR